MKLKSIILEIIKVEPYWNVKSIAINNYFSINEIKVEPYWNVKNDNNVMLTEIDIALK